MPFVDGVKYTWSVDGTQAVLDSENDSNSAIIDVTDVTSATLKISVIASNGTGSSVAKTLIIKKVTTACGKIAPKNPAVVAKAFKVVAYPNPSTEGFRIKSSNEKSFGVQVYDMLGRSIEQRKLNSDSQIGSNYAKGIYNVIVTQDAQVKTLRVIKK